jgi:predicted O-methyltransferase YrrM
MYSSFQLARKYVQYLLHASNGKGHGVHSPFVFDFIKYVLNDKKDHACYRLIEGYRKKLLTDQRLIEVDDHGAGSAVIKSKKRYVKDIAASSLKPAKYAQLLYRMVKYYQPGKIVELGTSFGITSSYLANGKVSAGVYTLEGAPAIAAIARDNFQQMDLKNITLVEGSFDDTLPKLLGSISEIDFAFVDGNHKKVPTVQYFDQLLQKASPKAILVFDDIHWSSEMEEAWQTIQQHPSTTLTIDLFFIGIVFINPDFKVKQHFQIRF